MTRRVIYSLYVDIPKKELDKQPPHHGETECKNRKAKREFRENNQWLRCVQERYAFDIGADYRFFEHDSQYTEYEKMFKEKYPQITSYNIVNFYKIHLMYELAKEYDEILYLDLDVVPLTSESFFDAWDLSKGHVIKINPVEEQKSRTIEGLQNRIEKFRASGKTPSIRSPFAKYWNSKAMMMMDSEVVDYGGAFNTGIVGITKEQLEQLDYFGDFEETLEMMDELKYDEDSFWPEFIRTCFGWDNETIWCWKVAKNNCEFQEIGDEWHYFMDKENIIFPSAKFVHVINKNFSFVRERYEQNNL